MDPKQTQRVTLRRKFYKNKRRQIRQNTLNLRNRSSRNYNGYTLSYRTGFPASKVVRMRYSSFDQLSTGALTPVDVCCMRANSIYSPEYQGYGAPHKPLGYDQWNVFYEKYVVLGSKIRVQFTTTNGTVSQPPLIGIYVSDTPVPAISTSSFIENSAGNYKLMAPSNNGNSVTRYITARYSAKKQHNITDIKDCESLEALFTANPTDETYYNIFMSYWNEGNSDTQTIQINFIIDYIVMLKDPKPLARSV